MTHPATAPAHRERLWKAVIAGDEYEAVEAVRAALADGTDEESLLLEVMAPVQERIGLEWAADRLTVAQEHTATAINERVVTALAHRHPGGSAGPPSRGRLTVCCVDGEWHAFPARLVAEVLRARGWQVDHLGVRTPTPHLIAHLHHTDPQAVLLSGSLATRLPGAHTAIAACRAIGVPVLAGGRAFGPGGRHARALGADRWAADARGAAAVLDAGLPRPVPAAVRQAVEDLPHLSDQEYTLVVRNRGRLVKRTLTDLAETFPAGRAHSDVQRERTAEDIAHVLDFLATALYVDDVHVFTDFLDWTADVLEARQAPAWSLPAALDSLAGALHDFPRCLALIGAGADAVRARTGRRVPAPGTREE